ncbi:MAG: crotonase/enoyl-CoA hydratase family protein [Protaetiibacter sp.]
MSAPFEPISDGVVVVERSGPILRMTLNRPEARNAINHEVALALGAAVELLRSDDSLRVGILTGAGAAFCAGMDLKAFAAGEPPIPPEHPEWGFAGFVANLVDKPVIAAVHGFAFGGGFELALTCDLIVAADDTRFGLPEVSRGLIAGAGGLPRIAQQIPAKIAARLVYTGLPMSAADAERWGLVTDVVPAAKVQDAAVVLAEQIAGNAPLALRTSKRLLTSLEHASMWEAESWSAVATEFEAIMATEDAAEGARAFVEKRPAEWRAR